MMFIVLYLSSNGLMATTYYVNASSGNNSNNGKSQGAAWKTIDHVNSKFNDGTIKNGDIIAFRAGQTFRGQLVINKSNITITNYDNSGINSGGKPILKAEKSFSGGWVSLGNNRYRKAISGLGNIYRIAKGSAMQRYARQPDYNTSTGDGYYHLDDPGYNGDFCNDPKKWAIYGRPNMFKDAQLPGNPDWQGATLWVTGNGFNVDVAEVVDHDQSNNIIKFDPRSDAWRFSCNLGYGYFFTDHNAAITKNGEWYVKNNNIYIYSNPGPGNATFYYTAYNHNITIKSGKTGVEIKNLKLQMSKDGGVKVENGANFAKIRNCEFRNQGKTGIVSYSANDLLIENSDFINILLSGIRIEDGRRVTVRNCYFTNILLEPEHLNEPTIEFGAIHFYSVSTGLIERCDINNVGFNGVAVRGESNGITVEKNRIRNYCGTLVDGGAVYVNTSFDGIVNGGGDYVPGTPNIIRLNTILEPSERGAYLRQEPFNAPHSLYADVGDKRVEFRDNFIYNNQKGGAIYGHMTTGMKVTGNIIFKCKRGYIQSDNQTDHASINNVFDNNSIVMHSNAPGYHAINHETEYQNRNTMGTYTNNYLISTFPGHKEIKEKYKNNSNNSVTDYFDPTPWNTARTYATGTKSSLVTTNSPTFKYKYNWSGSPISYNPGPGSWRNSKNQMITGSVTIPAWKGEVFVKVPSAMAMTQLTFVDSTQLAVYPNPILAGSQGNLQLKVEGIQRGEYQIKLYGLDGMIYLDKLITISSDDKPYVLSSQSPGFKKGLYLLDLRSISNPGFSKKTRLLAE